MKRKEYLDWKTYFMTVAKASAMRSKDPSTQVGAVVVNRLQQIVSTGYNGFPRGISDDDFPWEREGDFVNTKYPYVAHAELNAVVASRTDLTGCELYVTLFPCNECAKILIQAGISKIYFMDNKYDNEPNVIASKRMLDAAQISYELLPDLKIEILINDIKMD
ncbi:deoxycytidylate deaminase [Williamsoniiplasma lucivorax]|uniref:Deoxycytidylate deaminase n=1 Tax=Williamsoniiplasma lucivorax TaxID=209274 RepID=A0A2S5RE21_9MOLU|nr:dCMP deaminase family protein [Williamsoniiplasma lucivorax]PPE05462.1 deoxycytidylate deaminase [Williamsoniiplasma lucivorax]